MHLQAVWLYSLGKNENLFAMIQWFSLLVAVVTIYDISRQLKFSPTQSLLSALVGLSFPVILLQTYSFQGDLTVATFVLISISFGISFARDKGSDTVVWALVSLLLSITTKRGAYLALPVLGVTLLVLLVRRMRHKKWFPWLFGSIFFLIVIFGFLIYNYASQHNGTIADIPLIPNQNDSINHFYQKASYNSARFLYQFIGLDGLPRFLQNELIPGKTQLFTNLLPKGMDLNQQIYLQPGYDTSEIFGYSAPLILSVECAWFGPLAFLLLPLALFISLFSKQKVRRRYAVVVLALFVLFFILVLFQRPGWDPD